MSKILSSTILRMVEKVGRKHVCRVRVHGLSRASRDVSFLGSLNLTVDVQV